MSKLTLQEQLLLAIRVATRAHAGQKRKDGTDYIAHPMRCFARAAMAGESLVVQIALVLHDVVEDTKVTLEELEELGFDKQVLNGIDGMTKRPGESYLGDFIPRCKKNEHSRAGKNYDIDDNTEDQSALDPEEAAFLTKRYTKAKEILNGV
jgi:(p)ppGpp synthase/HD superfamily hydrolase